MVLLSFSHPGFDEKIPRGEKVCTTRKFSYKRFMQFYNNEVIHLYWKNRTKESKHLGNSVKVDLYFINFEFFTKDDIPSDIYDERELDFSVKFGNHYYAVYKQNVPKYFSKNLADKISESYKLMDEEWVEQYLAKEGFDSIYQLPSLYEFVTKNKKNKGNFFFVVEWKYPFLPEMKKKTGKLPINLDDKGKYCYPCLIHDRKKVPGMYDTESNHYLCHEHADYWQY
jgi:hypothetical protein